MQQIVRDALLFVVAPLAILGGMTAWMLAAAKPDCVNTVQQELLSPDQRFKAVLFQRSCAAEPAVSSHISILVASGILPDGAGNLFAAVGAAEPAGLQVQWQQQDTNQLQLTVSSKAQLQVLFADPVWSVNQQVTASYQLAGTGPATSAEPAETPQPAGSATPTQ